MSAAVMIAATTPAEAYPTAAVTGRALELAREANQELDTLLDFALEEIARQGPVYQDEQVMQHAVRMRGLACRMRELNLVLMTALNDITTPSELCGLTATLTGREAPADADETGAPA